MLKNFFKTAFRNIVKYKAYSLINFVGLTCGLTLALLIITYVRSEIGYDRFHTKADRLYRFRYTVNTSLMTVNRPPWWTNCSRSWSAACVSPSGTSVSHS